MRRLFFVLLLLALIGFGYHRWSTLNELSGGRRQSEHYTPVERPKLELKDLQVLSAIDAEYTKLISTVVPAVVSIRSRGTAPMDPFEMLFRRQLGSPAQVKRSLGSGVIVSKEGHVLTNAHVVEGMTEISVQLTDGRTVPARLIGADKQTDIAVLRISAPRIEPLPMGDSEDLRVGQMVFAIGNPFGLQATVTQGIISAKGRSISDSGVEFIQTDAAVNQGNSGGPLLNLRGEVIGINSAIYSETGGWLGISFAIPSNTAKNALESILKVGRVVRPFLGVLMGDLTEDLAQQFKAPDLSGALIHDVVPNSPAAQAGLQAGDIIREVNGRAIPNSAALRDRIGNTPVGSRLEIVFLRDGNQQKTTAEIVETPPTLPQPPTAPQGTRPAPLPPRVEQQSNRRPLSDLGVSEIPAALRHQLPDSIQGILITKVNPEAEGVKELRPGDIIEEINHQPVHTLKQLDQIASALPAGQQALVHLTRSGSRLFVVFTPR